MAEAATQIVTSRMPKQLGEILIEKGLLNVQDLNRALMLQREHGERLGRILVDLGHVNPRDVLETQSEQLGIPLISAHDFPSRLPATPQIPTSYMRQFRFLPLGEDGTALRVAMADPLDLETQTSIRTLTGQPISIVLAAENDILGAIEVHYGHAATPETDGRGFMGTGHEDVAQLRDMASETPVIRYVNSLIAQGLEQRASDIHLEPGEKAYQLRVRIDGVLEQRPAPPATLQAAVISRLKIMANLNIAEHRLPQDGRIQIKVHGKDLDLRVATLPTLHGESVVLRILDRSTTDFFDLTSLGFNAQLLSRMGRLTSLPHGLLLVTGPTGSGKSTTLYAALKRINSTALNIITIEDPVEYRMSGINQIHVNPSIGLTFASGLRHIVRQDPDVIMVGEIRDRETAEITIRAALTGHSVYSTLHTNDAPSSITRLTDMGVENYLLASSLVGVLAQRLVRVICSNCRQCDEVVTAPDSRRIQTWKGAGCEACRGQGFHGRIGVFELFELNEVIHRLIMNNSTASVLRKAARDQGMRSLQEDCWDKIDQGVTTLEEGLRATQES